MCSRPSSTLRAGFAGGLRPCLTAAARIAFQKLAGTKKRPITAEQRNMTPPMMNYRDLREIPIDSNVAIRERMITSCIIPEMEG
jgi:hypothetical protein